MDELTALRQQVAALQLQNTQLMVRLFAVCLLLVCTAFPFLYSYWSIDYYAASNSPLRTGIRPLTNFEQGLIKEQSPSPQSHAADGSVDGQNDQGAYTVGVMVLGASGKYCTL